MVDRDRLLGFADGRVCALEHRHEELLLALEVHGGKPPLDREPPLAGFDVQDRRMGQVHRIDPERRAKSSRMLQCIP